MKLHASGEDYLEAILVLQKEKGMVRSADVARHLEVSKPSVCHAVATLRDGGFLTMDEKLSEIWQPLTQDPAAFKGGAIWQVMLDINDALKAIGYGLLGWGVVQVGLSFQSHDPSQRSQGFLTLAGGLVVTFAKEILDLITGGTP